MNKRAYRSEPILSILIYTVMFHSALLRSFLLSAVLVLATGALFAQSDNVTIAIQGTLKDANGVTVPDGQRQIVFELYDSIVAGNLLWDETATVQVTGGIYSHNLGSVDRLVGADFAQTVFLDLTVGGQHMTPRTQMTYAPYALSVDASQRIAEGACSGQVGDIKYSILNPQQFRTQNGTCWVAMDGRDVTGSRLEQIAGFSNVPDMGGLFMRAAEWQGGADRDPERTAGTAAGSLQTDATKAHRHGVNIPFNATTNRTGDHSHSYSRGGGRTCSGTGCSGNQNIYTNLTEGASTGSTGAHSHTVSGTINGNTAEASGSETRPANRNFYVYIRIN